jgi:hypothetical protein
LRDGVDGRLVELILERLDRGGVKVLAFTRCVALAGGDKPVVTFDVGVEALERRSGGF